VNAEHRIDGKLDEQAVVDHRLCAGSAFFGRLKDKYDRSIKLTMFREVASRA
jgi:hypothetical protein